MNKPNKLPSNWFITGGCGFIGTNLIASLVEESDCERIRVLDNLSEGTKSDLNSVCKFHETDVTSQKKPDHLATDKKPTVELIVGDINNYRTCLACAAGMDIVVHLAAHTGVGPSVENPRQDMESNVIGTFNLLEAARQNVVKRFVFASSGAPIGECEPPIHEEIAPHPVSPYGASKLAGEGYCSAYYRTYGLETVALRFGNVYGPRSKHKNSVIATFFKRALSGKPLEIFGDGDQTRDFIYIDDLITAILLAARSPVGGDVFQIATFKETTVNEIAQTIKKIVEAETGQPVTVVHKGSRPGDVRRNYSDISKAMNRLGYLPKNTLEKGLRSTLNYYRRGNPKEKS
jgi:UDP-glucose 4-epimerase